jgi:hypothetical protein
MDWHDGLLRSPQGVTMPYCPKCRYEYLPTVRECPECGVALVDEPPKGAADAPITEPLVVVYEAPEEVMAIMARDLLEDAGIPVLTQSGLIPWHDDMRFAASGFHSRLLVFESQADEARRLIAGYLADIESGAAGK